MLQDEPPDRNVDWSGEARGEYVGGVAGMHGQHFMSLASSEDDDGTFQSHRTTCMYVCNVSKYTYQKGKQQCICLVYSMYKYV